MAGVANLQTWAREFPTRARWNPVAYLRQLEALLERGGDPVTVEAALTALRDLGQPPKPAGPPPQHVPPGGQQSGAVPRFNRAQHNGALHVSSQPSGVIQTGDFPFQY